MNAKPKYKVLIADDSEDDRLFLRLTLQRNPRFQLVGEVEDGEETIEYLSGSGKFSDRQTYPFPDVLLLDIKMPRKTGHEVLDWLRSQPSIGLFVAVVSGSGLQEDVTLSFSLGASGHFKKDAFKEQQSALLQAIEQVLDKT